MGSTVAAFTTGETPSCDAARAQAVRECLHGVLVTRHGPGSFTVTVSRDIAYGLTLERDDWHDRAPVCPGANTVTDGEGH